jgi:hypothetical protein
VSSGWRAPLFYVILAVYLLAGVLFATLTPAWQAPDEPAHYNYVRYLARQSGFPELIGRCYNQAYLEQLKSRRFPPELSLEPVCYEFHQPPLYYLLATPLFLLSNGTLLALRLLSVVLGAGVVILAWNIARAIFPGRAAISYGTMAFVALIPMHVAMLASVNNDALAELILAILLFLLTRRLIAQARPTPRDDIFLGLLLGLGLITKITVYIAVPLTAVTLWWVSGREAGLRRGEVTDRYLSPPNWPALLKQMALVYGLALLIALPWYGRNATLYGPFDILGLGRHDAVVVGQLRTADFITSVGWQTYLYNFITTTFDSFWGQFGWMAVPMSERVYLVLTLLTLAALGGLIGFWILDCPSGGRGFWKTISSSHNPHLTSHISQPTSHTSRTKQALALIVLTILLMVLGYLWYNLEFVQFQGRYLFPALIPLGLFFSLGLYKAFSPDWAWGLVGGLTLALGWVVIASLASSDLDKWAVLIIALPLALAVGRAWLASHWLIPASWLLMIVYTGLALLTLISPFWYVIPYLSP